MSEEGLSFRLRLPILETSISPPYVHRASPIWRSSGHIYTAASKLACKTVLLPSADRRLCGATILHSEKSLGPALAERTVAAGIHPP